jgi:hypothetical protein
MTLSAELQERYSTEVAIDWHNAFILSHPKATTRYLIDHYEEVEAYVDIDTNGDGKGPMVLFLPVPAQIEMPTLDDSGNQDLRIVWCGIQGEAKAFLDQAIQDPSSPVSCRHSIYIEGDPLPQSYPWTEFYLSSVTITEQGVSVTASRSDILNHMFPTEVYRVDKFPGVRRT